MKYLITLFVPILIFSQNNYKDKLYLIDGKEYSCMLTSMDEHRVSFVYLNNINESIIWDALDKLEIDSYGIVYQKGKGFISDFDLVKDFINQRTNKILSKEHEKKLLIESEITKLKPNLPSHKKWSVGLLFIPFYSGENYRVSYESYPRPNFYIFTNSFNEVNLEWFLNYSLSNKFDLSFDVSYSSDYSERRSVYSETSSLYSANQGSFVKSSMKKFNIHLGVKYYLFQKEQENVNVFFLAGFGRQIAFSEEITSNLFPNPNSPIVEDNMSDFLEDINSPWHFNAGFGTEYFLNNSVSLTSAIRFLYSSSSGTYKIRLIEQSYTSTSELETSISKVITRIGFGLNFYF